MLAIKDRIVAMIHNRYSQYKHIQHAWSLLSLSGKLEIIRTIGVVILISIQISLLHHFGVI